MRLHAPLYAMMGLETDAESHALQKTLARVVAVSSEGHRLGHIDLEDLHWKKRKYNSFVAYGKCLLLYAMHPNVTPWHSFACFVTGAS